MEVRLTRDYTLDPGTLHTNELRPFYGWQVGLMLRPTYWMCARRFHFIGHGFDPSGESWGDMVQGGPFPGSRPYANQRTTLLMDGRLVLWLDHQTIWMCAWQFGGISLWFQWWVMSRLGSGWILFSCANANHQRVVEKETRALLWQVHVTVSACG